MDRSDNILNIPALEYMILFYICIIHLSFNSSFLNPEQAGTELIWFNVVNIMVANAQAPCVTRTTAAMILTM